MILYAYYIHKYFYITVTVCNYTVAIIVRNYIPIIYLKSFHIRKQLL